MNRRRLDVEAWRDAMLAVAGRLDATVGGPSISLDATGESSPYIYAAISRHDLAWMLRLFDFPDPNITSGGRVETTVPLQQLFVLNSEFMVANARAVAARLLASRRARPERRRPHPPAHTFLLYGRAVTERRARSGPGVSASRLNPTAGAAPRPRNDSPSRWATLHAGPAGSQRVLVYRLISDTMDVTSADIEIGRQPAMRQRDARSGDRVWSRFRCSVVVDTPCSLFAGSAAASVHWD